jgi:hypothetical protein
MVYLAGILSKFSNEVRAATTVSVYLLVYEIIMLGSFLYTMTALASNLSSWFFLQNISLHGLFTSTCDIVVPSHYST